MKNVLIFLILGGFFSLLLFYILKEFSPFELSKIDTLIKTNALNPGEWDKLNSILKDIIDQGKVFEYLSNIAYIAFGVLLAAIFSFFTALHLFVDKLFFKNYYEKPSLFDAMRRAILLVATIALVVYMKLSLLENTVIVLVPVSAVIIELIFVSTINPFINKRIKKNTPVEKPLEVKPQEPKDLPSEDDKDENSDKLDV